MIDPTVLRTLAEKAKATWPLRPQDRAIAVRPFVEAMTPDVVLALLDENAALRAERDFLLEAVKASEADGIAYGKLIAEMAAVAEAVRSVCPSDETTGVTEEFKYVCHDEDGEPIVEANTLGDAVAQIIACWNRGGEQHEALESRLAALKAAGEKVVAWGEGIQGGLNEACLSLGLPLHAVDPALDAFKAELRSDP